MSRRLSSSELAASAGLLVVLCACGGGSDDVGDLDAQIPADAGASTPDAADAAQMGSGAGAGTDATIEDVDLTLGGLNQDLPAPPGDCMNSDGSENRCLAVSGVYNGAAFQIACKERELDYYGGDPPRVGCEGAAPEGDITVTLELARDLVWRPTKLIQVDGDARYTHVSVSHWERKFATHPSGVFTLAATHTLTSRVRGISESPPFASTPSFNWKMRGVFALSVVPKPDCVPTSAAPCDEVRLRAAFFAPLYKLQGEK